MKRPTRLRFIAQQRRDDGVLACVAMVATSLGRRTTVVELDDCGLGRDGLLDASVLKLGNYLDLKIRNCRCASLEEPLAETFPILRLKHNQWVIVQSVSATRCLIMDPVIGRKVVPRNVLAEMFDRQYIVLSAPTHAIPVERPSGPLLPAFIAAVLKEISALKWSFLLIVPVVLIQLLGLASPFFILWAIDRQHEHVSGNISHLLLGLAIVLIFAHASSGLLRSLILLGIRSNFALVSMDQLVRNTLTLPLAWISRFSRVELLSRVAALSELHQVLSDSAIAALLDGLFVVTYLIWLFAVELRLALLVAAVALVELIALYSTVNKQRELARASYRDLSAHRSALHEIVSNVEYLKATGSENFARARWRELLKAELQTSAKRARLSYAVSLVNGVCTFGGPLLTIWYGLVLVSQHRMTTGKVIAAEAIVCSIFWPLGSFVNVLAQLRGTTSNLDKIEPLLKPLTSLQARAVSADVDSVRGRLSIKHVSYRYPGCQCYALRDVSIKAEPGETIGLVGRSGSGKSTLGLIALGLLDPEEGLVSLSEAQDLPITEQSCYRHRGVVLQSPLIVRGSVSENVTFGIEGISMDAVVEACKRVCIHEDIVSLPQGYDTLLADSGCNFSGGQRQRIALARAVVGSPTILLLDEATSQLDPYTEKQISTFLATLKCTQIVIAHRLHTLKRADRIYVLERGEVVQEGTYQTLCETEGLFRSMVADRTV